MTFNAFHTGQCAILKTANVTKRINTRTALAILSVFPLLACVSDPSPVLNTCQTEMFERDTAETQEHCQQAAKQGEAQAQYYVGMMYLEGRGVAQDEAQAVPWLKKAAEQGHAAAQSRLEQMSDKGKGENVKKAETQGILPRTARLNQLKEAMGQRDAEAQYKLGYELLHEDAWRNETQGMQWIRKAVEQGHAGAQTELGLLYYRGRAVAQDSTKAVKWFKMAAEQGHEEAQYWLGLMYDKGEGVEKDEAEAAKWLRKAAEQGEMRAHAILQRMEWLKQLKEAVERGDTEKQYRLGFGFIFENFAQDEAEGVQWLRKAVEQGHPGAQTKLGVLYYRGQAVSQDSAKAVKWFRMAAEQGYVEAQYWLGLMYSKGEGVEKDEEKAARWLRKAAEQGVAEAQEALRKMGE
jgi:TPR repeat protein